MRQVKPYIKKAIQDNTPIIIIAMVSAINTALACAFVPYDKHILNAIHDIYYGNTQPFIYHLIIIYSIGYGFKCYGYNNKNIKKYLEFLKPEYIISGIVTIICVAVCMLSYNIFKHCIPLIKPFSWDPILLKADLILLNKHSFWLLIDKYLPINNLNKIFDMIYISWFILFLVIVFWQQVTADRQLRKQFFTAWLATWFFLGNITAVLFSSAGPCFYDEFYKSTPAIIQPVQFKLNALNTSELKTDIAKSELIENSRKTTFRIGYGISAFPSLHVAVSVIYALLFIKKFKNVKCIAWLYVFLIMISCVYLGFHYMVDCIAGFFGGIITWYIAGNICKDNSNYNETVCLKK